MLIPRFHLVYALDESLTHDCLKKQYLFMSVSGQEYPSCYLFV